MNIKFPVNGTLSLYSYHILGILANMYLPDFFFSLISLLATEYTEFDQNKSFLCQH